jgi:5-methylcytosine-specific restriction endonuclease McrA
MSRGKNRNYNTIKRARRFNLMKQDPHCWYCGLELVYVEIAGTELPYNYPTIEHLFSRSSGRLSVNHTDETRRVLACPDCNQSRAFWEDKLKQAGIDLRRYGGEEGTGSCDSRAASF